MRRVPSRGVGARLGSAVRDSQSRQRTSRRGRKEEGRTVVVNERVPARATNESRRHCEGNSENVRRCSHRAAPKREGREGRTVIVRKNRRLTDSGRVLRREDVVVDEERPDARLEPALLGRRTSPGLLGTMLRDEVELIVRRRQEAASEEEKPRLGKVKIGELEEGEGAQDALARPHQGPLVALCPRHRLARDDDVRRVLLAREVADVRPAVRVRAVPSVERTAADARPVERRRVSLPRMGEAQGEERRAVRDGDVEREPAAHGSPVALEPASCGLADLDERRDGALECVFELVGAVVTQPRSVRVEVGEEERDCERNEPSSAPPALVSQRGSLDVQTCSESVLPWIVSLAECESCDKMRTCASIKPESDDELVRQRCASSEKEDAPPTAPLCMKRRRPARKG